jgi:hypothetical protein
VKVLRRILFEGFATGDTGIVDELCLPDLIEHQFGLEGHGPHAIARVKEAIIRSTRPYRTCTTSSRTGPPEAAPLGCVSTDEEQTRDRSSDRRAGSRSR